MFLPMQQSSCCCRELDLKRRDLIRPDLNKQYALLCNPSTPVPSFLFGNELNKDVEELIKSHKFSNKVTPKKRTTKSLQVEVCVVVAALARVVFVEKSLQVRF